MTPRQEALAELRRTVHRQQDDHRRAMQFHALVADLVVVTLLASLGLILFLAL